ncbi:MAG: UvrD-helicase domain-containing protein [Rickettsiaceae bacterium]|nr:UvrD-helicase domain-containing protein [Rickettsiaceae bacterium]MDP4832406.1 UvrD-helicase domain-containing protein [Rickettsiaceae bacterium]MDP5020135.1 UvrD-helicase domain-containing protein [Rickettsiaceae bacterium]MDP5082767.1 UvrD-helicase domain-containing protein [Rickettsiaceae bacterium]
MTNDLNLPQAEAVQCTEGPLLILAGAGTGKTKVLTARIAHIIEQRLAYPSNILAVTFTNKASKEMQERVNNITHADGLNIGTFHSIAARMLRSHINLLNLDLSSSFTIINQDDQVKLLKNIQLQHNIDIKQYAPKMLHAIISRWKDQGIIPEKLSDTDFISPAHKIAKSVYTEYQRQMHASNAVDFGDLLLYCNQLLINNPDILEHYQNKFKYILIDEYQDTNAVQYIWARMLASKHKNICCVGDDDQSIYSWRGAEVKNILRFEKDFPNAKVIKLEQNYRSTPYILKAASSVIAHNKNRHSKELWTNQEPGKKIQIISCWNDKEEARFISTETEKSINSGLYKARQIAILVRAGFQTRAFEEVFISNALPYQIIGGLRFYERMEVRDLLAYIRLSMNNNDNLALERIINVPKRSIGNVTLKKIKDFASERELSVFAALTQMLQDNVFTGRTKDSLQHFVNLIILAGKKYENESAFEVTKFILEESKYLAILKAEQTEESRARIENINEMLKAIDEFDNIVEFVEHSSLVMDNETLESDFGGTVKIMTLHAAKGLEFDLVFLPGWEENVFPHQKALSEEGEKGLEEERRIAYVGITRAKKELYITYAENRRVFAEILNSIPSRFLMEIPDVLCEKHSSTNRLNYMGSRHNFSMQPNKVKTPTQIDTSGKKPGNRVYHQKFGSGIIVRKNGDSLEIAFEKLGLKTIKEDYVEEV